MTPVAPAQDSGWGAPATPIAPATPVAPPQDSGWGAPASAPQVVAQPAEPPKDSGWGAPAPATPVPGEEGEASPEEAEKFRELQAKNKALELEKRDRESREGPDSSQLAKRVKGESSPQDKPWSEQ